MQMEVNSPLVSVVIPVHNGEALLRDAVASVLAQTLSNLELIILDDGSRDATWEVCQSFTDPRIRVFRHDNMGVAATMNRGISLARGRYFARLDHDDLMLPEKLEKQHDFLDEHSNIALTGTWADIRSVDNIPTGRMHEHVTSCDAIRFFLLFDNPFVQSSMLVRLDVLRGEGGYCEDRSREPDDYELFSRLARHHVIVNLPEVLTIYRETANSLSRFSGNPLLPKVVRIAAENLHLVLQPDYSLKDCTRLAAMYHHTGDEPLSLFQALRMVRLAVARIGGESGLWSDELKVEAERIRRHLIALTKHRMLSSAPALVLRRTKHKLLRMVGIRRWRS